MSEKGIFGSIAMVIGTAVGAGIFGIPYAFAHVGALAGMFYLIILGGGVVLITLAYAEVVLRTKGRHQFFGYAERYLGKKAKILCSFILIFGIIGSLIAYIIEVGTFSHALLAGIFGGQVIHYSLAFFVLASGAVYFGLGMVVKLEKFMVFFLLFVVASMCAIGLPKVDFNNLKVALFETNYILPYGVILFAAGAASIVPELKDALGKRKKYIGKVVIIGMGLTMFIFAAFALIILGATGSRVTESAMIGAGEVLGKGVLYLGSIFGILAMSTSFLSLGLVLRNAFMRDFNISKNLAWLAVFVPPLVIVLLSLTSFIQVIGIVGAVLGSLEGIIILLLWRRAKKQGKRKPEYVIKIPGVVFYLLMLIFVVGFVSTLIYIF